MGTKWILERALRYVSWLGRPVEHGMAEGVAQISTTDTCDTFYSSCSAFAPPGASPRTGMGRPAAAYFSAICFSENCALVMST
jgi:hypothetical protein